MTDQATVPYGSAYSGSDKLWSVLCHLSGFFGFPFLLPLVVYLVMRGESEYVAAHAKEALNFHLSCFIYALVCVPFCFILIGIPFALALLVVPAILAVVAAVKASDGVYYRYPWTLRLVG
jgi:uncharacterized Tic20 family protein